MIHKLRISLVLSAFFALIGAPAFAENVFLVQLGSFPSEAEARQAGEAIKKANAEALGKLPVTISAVTVDDHVIYRTQAGPLASRDQAQSLCSTLSGAKQCLIAESAMYASADPAPVPSPAPVAQAAPAAAEPSDNVAMNKPLPLPDAPEELAAAEPAAGAEQAPAPEENKAMPRMLPALTFTPESAPEEAKTEKKSAAMPAPAPAAAPAQPAAPAPAKPAAMAAVAQMAAPAAMAAKLASTRQPLAQQPFTPPANLRRAQAAPAPAPVMTEAAPTVAAAPTAPVTVSAPAATMGETGNLPPSQVNVAEAIRVPLSGNADAGQEGARTYVPNPSQRALWAQLGPFQNEGAAMGFWEQLQVNHADVTNGVRMRVVKPYLGSFRQQTVSVRAGPYGYMDQIRSLCQAANQNGIRCAVVTDLGNSGAVIPRPRMVSPRGYHRSSFEAPGASFVSQGSAANWVQLGSYPSPQAAQDAWMQAQSTNPDLLGRQQSNVAMPPAGSNSQPVYRLRTGPFVSAIAANNLCARLTSRGVSCLVVAGR